MLESTNRVARDASLLPAVGAVAALVVLGASLTTLACDAEPALEFAPWTIPVPEDVTVHDHAPVPDADRVGARIEVERDLVFGGDAGSALYRPTDVAVDEDGNAYVTDWGDNNLKIFGPEGELRATVGREGEGPGEFQMPFAVAVLGERVLVADRRLYRISVVDRDGTFVEDQRLDADSLPNAMQGLDDERYLAYHRPGIPLGLEDPPTYYMTVSLRAFPAEVVQEYVSLPVTVGVHLARTRGRGSMYRSVPMSAPSPRLALGPDGRAFVTSGEEYQVLAFDERGEPDWALRVAEPPAPVTEQEIEAVLEAMREDDAAVRRDEINWPERHPAIGALELDGRGFLYVFPYRFRPPGSPEAPEGDVPVDVYSPEGERVFSGLIDMPGWSGWNACLGEHVYRFDTDEAGERVLVRYRLVTPF